MATVLREDTASRGFDISFKARKHEVRLQVIADPGELLLDTDVYAEVIAWLTQRGMEKDYFGARIESLKAEPVEDNFWRATVGYGSGYVPDNDNGTKELPEVEWNGTTRGRSARVMQAIQNITSIRVIYPGGNYAPPTNNNGAIGVSRDGDRVSVEGVDVIIPHAEESGVIYWTDAKFTPEYKRLLREFTGAVNDSPFLGMAAGEVMFAGADWSRYSNTLWKTTYFFEYEVNRNDITIGTAQNIPKRGWDYLWVTYQDCVDAGSSRMTRRADEVYVDQVSEYRDLKLLAPGIFQ